MDGTSARHNMMGAKKFSRIVSSSNSRSTSASRAGLMFPPALLTRMSRLPPAKLERGIGESRYCVCVMCVEGDRLRPVPECGHLRDGGLGLFCAVHVGHQDVRAASCEPGGDAASDVTRPSGDERDPSRQIRYASLLSGAVRHLSLLWFRIQASRHGDTSG